MASFISERLLCVSAYAPYTFLRKAILKIFIGAEVYLIYMEVREKSKY